MSINSEIERIAAAKAALKSAINAKGGALTNELLGSYADAVTALPSGADVSGVTATVADVDATVKFVTSDGTLTQGTMPRVTQPQPTITVSNAGVVTASYTPVLGRVTSNASRSRTYTLTTKAAATYTPTTTDQIIAAEQYLTGAQTIKGDANLIPANIAENVTIFGVTGTHSGGGSALFDAVKVTAFQKYRAPFTAISKVTLSGFEADEGAGTDNTVWNDDYAITPTTMYETDWRKRVYQKTNKVYNNTYYLYYYEYSDDDPPMMFGGSAWMIGSTIGASYGAIGYESDNDLTEGTITWTDEMWMNPTCIMALTTMSEPEQEALFTGVKATAYNSTTKMFTFANTVIDLTDYDSIPAINQVYLANETKLIGDRACSGVTPPDVVFYLNPAQYGMQDVAGGLVGEPSSADMIVDGKYVFNGNSYITFDTSNAGWLNFGEDQDVTIEWFSKTTARTTSYPAEITNGTSWTTNCFTLRYRNDVGERRYSCYWNPGDPFIYGETNYGLNVRRHLAFVRSGHMAYLFVDGELQAYADCTGRVIDFTLFNVLRLGWESWNGTNGYFTGEIDEVRITKKALYTASFTPPEGLGYDRELLYIRNTNVAGQYINTGVAGYSERSSGSIRFDVTAVIDTQQSEAIYIFGERTGNDGHDTDHSYSLVAEASGGGISIEPADRGGDRLYLQYSSGLATIDITINRFFTEISDATLMVNGNSTSLDFSIYKANPRHEGQPIYIFGINDEGRYIPATRLFDLYKFRLSYYDNSQDPTTVRDYIPVMAWNGEACLYDRTAKQLYYNQGQGSFGYAEKNTIRQAIPVGFTSNTSINGYTINQSSGDGSYPQAWCVFNLNSRDGDYAWWTGSVGVSASNPAWFSIHVPEAFVPSRIYIMNEISSPENFRNALFQGSNDGETWTTLVTITDSPNTTGLEQTFDVTTSTAYSYFRMYFTESHASGVSIQAFTIYKGIDPFVVVSPQKATSNTGTGYTLSASSVYSSNYEAWKAFDGNPIASDHGWFSASGDTSPWLQIEFTSAKTVSSYEFCAAYDSQGQTLSEWTLSGSNDGTSWTDLHTVLNQSLNSTTPKYSSAISNSTAYRYYRLSFPSTFGYSYIGVQSVKLKQPDYLSN